MATNPRKEQTQPMWPRPGTRMAEQEYHELERLSPDRRYEYIEGLAYLMSGGSVAHDRIAYNARLASVPFAGQMSRYSLPSRNMRNPILPIQTQWFLVMQPIVNQRIP